MKVTARPLSRLSVWFILAIIIPGGLLAWLSIANISKTRTLTEWKVQEEQNIITDTILNLLHGHIEDYINSTELTFEIGPGSEWLKPRFIEAGMELAGSYYSEGFYREYSLAQQQEYINKNPGLAAKLYLKALDIAENSRDSAKAAIGAARLTINQNKIIAAIQLYKIVLNDIPGALDENGYPFAYYAISQIESLRDSISNIEYSDLIESFLQNINLGVIPLTKSTTDLLKQFNQNWLADEDSKLKRQELLNSIQEQLAFIARSEDLIGQEITSNTRIYDYISGKYYPLVHNTVEGTRLILISQKDSLGFTDGYEIHLTHIFDNIIQKLDSSETFFDHHISIRCDPFLLDNSVKDYYTIRPINTYLPSCQVMVSLKNEDQIIKLVHRRNWIFGLALFLMAGGFVLGIMLIMRDISREKKLSGLRTDFVSNVSHELKTPLTAINLFTQSILLGRIKTKKKQNEYLNIILSETERLKRLINTVLSFSKFEQSRMDLYLQDIDLSKLVKSVLLEMEYWLKEKQFKVEKSVLENIIIKADPDAITQALFNLISNSIKYSDENRCLVIRLWETDENVFIEVADKGIGIPPEELTHIFEKYYRIQPAGFSGSTGTGLGLTVTRDIIEAHGGEISVKSKPGEGTSFTIQLNREFIINNE